MGTAGTAILVGVGIFVVIFLGILGIVAMAYGKIWFQAYMSSADISLLSLIGMGFRQVNPRIIVAAKIMAGQAGLDIGRRAGISTSRLEAHFLAGGNVMNVINAIIAAHRAGIDLDFDRAAAIDLALEDYSRRQRRFGLVPDAPAIDPADGSG